MVCKCDFISFRFTNNRWRLVSYEARSRTPLALVPENPQDCDADLSDDEDRAEGPDDQPAEAGESGDTSPESVDEEEEPPTPLPCPHWLGLVC